MERVLSTFDREREKLEERARAVGETETRQRAAAAELRTEAERLAKAAEALELARREEDVTRREIQLSLLRRRIGEEERRLQERAWRTGALPRRARRHVAARPTGDVTFSEGWQRLAGRRGGDPGDRGSGSW
jgi:hypothetical protein